MIVFDIIVVFILLLSVYYGFREGILVQAGGLVGLFAGAYLAFRLGAKTGDFLKLDENVSTAAGFVIVLVAVIIAVALIGRMLKGAFRFAGLGILDRLGGAVLSVLKAGLIAGLLLYGFNSLNGKSGWVRQEKLNESFFYAPLITATGYAFPYIDLLKDKILIQDSRENGESPEREEI